MNPKAMVRPGTDRAAWAWAKVSVTKGRGPLARISYHG